MPRHLVGETSSILINRNNSLVLVESQGMLRNRELDRVGSLEDGIEFLELACMSAGENISGE